ncbi:MAG: hypothetical protein FJ284_03495 [Planctomycetes bacterium]|nr:hypothetical protein [Planctomycetota bacterium]
MSDGNRVNVDVLCHDTSRPSGLKVLSLTNSFDADEYSSIAFLQRTAGTAAVSIDVNTDFEYRRADGSIPIFEGVGALIFRWSGEQSRAVSGIESYSLSSKNNGVSFASDWQGTTLDLSECADTGTYTIIAFGAG